MNGNSVFIMVIIHFTLEDRLIFFTCFGIKMPSDNIFSVSSILVFSVNPCNLNLIEHTISLFSLFAQ